MRSISLQRYTARLAAVLAVFTIATGVAEEREASIPSSPTEFIKGALQASEVEMRAGKLAQQKSQNPAVQQLGQAVANDQKEIHAKLRAIAEQKQIQQQGSLQKEHEKQFAELQNASGADFDRKFVEQMVKDHQRDLAMLEKCSEKFADDAEIAKLIQNNRSTVEKHLRLARNVAKSLNIEVESSSAVGSAAEAESGARTDEAKEQDRSGTSAKEGDGEILGLPTSNNDGTILGVFPAPSRVIEAGNEQESYVAEELADGKIDKGVDNILEADRDTVAVPPTSEREKAAGEVLPDRPGKPQE